jgi:hypothetical protein
MNFICKFFISNSAEMQKMYTQNGAFLVLKNVNGGGQPADLQCFNCNFNIVY